jgi:hypothetical protein
VEGLAILLLVNTVATAIFVLLGYRPPTDAFVGAGFLEAAALLIVGAPIGMYREQYLRQGLQMVFLGVLLFLVGGAIDWVGFWFGI